MIACTICFLFIKSPFFKFSLNQITLCIVERSLVMVVILPNLHASSFSLSESVVLFSSEPHFHTYNFLYTEEFTSCYSLHDCSFLLSRLHPLAPICITTTHRFLATQLTDDYHDRNFIGKCDSALMNTTYSKVSKDILLADFFSSTLKN